MNVYSTPKHTTTDPKGVEMVLYIGMLCVVVANVLSEPDEKSYYHSKAGAAINIVLKVSDL